jgi:hypothetical protein
MSARTLTRRAATALVAGAVAVIPMATATPAFAAGSGKILASPCLNLRTGPSSAYGVVACIPVNTYISIDCTLNGASVTGPYNGHVEISLGVRVPREPGHGAHLAAHGIHIAGARGRRPLAHRQSPARSGRRAAPRAGSDEIDRWVLAMTTGKVPKPSDS